VYAEKAAQIHRKRMKKEYTLMAEGMSQRPAKVKK
jgi:hypothetical protein